MGFKNIILEKRDGVAEIVLSRPRVLNAINSEMLLELKRAIKEAQLDEGVRVLVIRGVGERAFSVGADVKEMVEAGPMRAREFSRLGKGVMEALENLGKPVIAGVNGLALGGGCELAMACDIVIASENARFGQPEINVGIIPGWGGSQRLPRLAGWKKAKELIFTGDAIDAREAERIGLVNRVVPADRLDEAVNELVQKLLSKSPLTLKLAKDVMVQGIRADLPSGLAHETEVFSLCFSTEDGKEGMRALLEKRKPEFRGR
ncbi:MAG: enoyl-CoA hydratase/isomerase family protein [Candidatus Bathyarchaeia archaeon]